MHDGSYGHVFARVPIVEDLPRGFVREDGVSQIDYGGLEKGGGGHVTDDLREREDDAIGRVTPEDDGPRVYLLIEFQGRRALWMVRRSLVYAGRLYQDLVKGGRIVEPNKSPPDLSHRDIRRRKPLAGRLRSGRVDRAGGAGCLALQSTLLLAGRKVVERTRHGRSGRHTERPHPAGTRSRTRSHAAHLGRAPVMNSYDRDARAVPVSGRAPPSLSCLIRNGSPGCPGVASGLPATR